MPALGMCGEKKESFTGKDFLCYGELFYLQGIVADGTYLVTGFVTMWSPL